MYHVRKRALMNPYVQSSLTKTWKYGQRDENGVRNGDNNRMGSTGYRPEGDDAFFL